MSMNLGQGKVFHSTSHFGGAAIEVGSHLSPMTRAIYSLREREDSPEPQLHEILEAVSKATFLPVVRIKSESRVEQLVHARFIYYRLCRLHTSRSLTAIGMACGGRDHSTVNNGFHRFKHFDSRERFHGLFLAAQAILAERLEAKG